MHIGPQHVLASRLRQQVSGRTAAACDSFRLFDLQFDTSLTDIAFPYLYNFGYNIKFSLSSQLDPLKTGGHSHLREPTSISIQVPPLSHGVTSHWAVKTAIYHEYTPLSPVVCGLEYFDVKCFQTFQLISSFSLKGGCGRGSIDSFGEILPVGKKDQYIVWCVIKTYFYLIGKSTFV